MFFRLTERDCQLFHQQGYLIVKGLLNRQETDLLMRLAKSDQVLQQQAYSKRDASGAESRLVVRNELLQSPYAPIVSCRRIVEAMEKLLGDEVYHYHHKMMLKEPRVGGAWEWHQDYGYWYNNGCLFPDMASCLIAIDRADRANGCLQVIKGSHKMGRIDHLQTGGQTGADLARVQAALDRMELVYCELEPGDAIFFHGNLLHRSDQNLSENPRWSLICCYNTRGNDPYLTDGRHPNYSPLEIQDDSGVLDSLAKWLDG
jgi:ectoine hydroxylase